MRRRSLLGGLATATTGGFAGCGLLSSGPEPAIVEHVRGDVEVTETERVLGLQGGGDTIRATVENTGFDAEVELRLYWVPEVGADPVGKTHEQLRDSGYELVAETRVDLASGESRRHSFDATYPDDVAGYYVRKRNTTYGAIVENRGEAGQVTAELVDTSDLDDTRVLATKTVEMAADERRPISFSVEESFDVFRVEFA